MRGTRRAVKLIGRPPLDESRWEGRPIAAAAVRALVMFGPIAVSTIAVWVAAGQLVPRDASLFTVVLFWIGLSTIASGLLLVVDHQVRRLIPLAMMLDLSLVFPDKAPSRMLMAMGTMNARELEQELNGAKAGGDSTTPAGAAERLLRLVAALGQHDWTTRGHSERVRAYSQVIAAEMGLSSRDRDLLNWAALIHDVGKLTVPAALLNKRGGLTDIELDVVRRHAEEGVRLVEPLRVWLGEWCEAVADHHEKWDGTGYPKGLSGTEISLGGRIVAVADAFDVMTSSRSYTRVKSVAGARKELVECSGTHFDPAVVRAMLNMSAGGMRLAVGPLAWLAYLPAVARVPWSSVSATGTSIGSLGVATVTLASLPVVPADAIAAPLAVFDGNEAISHVAPATARPASLEEVVGGHGATVVEPEESLPRRGDRPRGDNSPSQDQPAPRAPGLAGSPNTGSDLQMEPRRVASDDPAVAIAPNVERGPAEGETGDAAADSSSPGAGAESPAGGDGESGGPPAQDVPVGDGQPDGGAGTEPVPSGNGNGQGQGSTQGNGNGQGNANGQGQGNANGQGQGNANGQGQGQGQGNANGQGNGQGNGIGSSQGDGGANGEDQPNGNGQGNSGNQGNAGVNGNGNANGRSRS